MTKIDEAPEAVNMDDNTSKISFVWGLLRKMGGVKDIASVRLSLPANLMEPRSNLEFWNYNDRPDYFDDPAERMLHVLRWFLMKDTKWKAQNPQIRKPFNPVLGEIFQCDWKPTFHDEVSQLSNTLSTTTLTDEATLTDQHISISCVTEQLVHNPPISAFHYSTTAKGGITARGVDHVSAKFTGTAIKIGAGEHNHGIYITLGKHNEEYNCTYPWASVSGWITGNPYITVSEITTVTCPASKLMCVLHYKDEPYFGAPKFAVEGKIFRYDPASAPPPKSSSSYYKDLLKKVPEKDVLATIHGQWNGKVYAKLTSTKKEGLLFDLQASETHEKIVPPLEKMGDYESRKLWHKVAEAIHAKDFNLATKLKRDIEDEHRKLRAARGGDNHVSRFFEFKTPIITDESVVDASLLVERGKPYLKEEVASRKLSVTSAQ
ncbi:hypothetical protein BDR26DRAFT_851454 [Obelidium mucronatum]|nr:hypothetical protein BDR26DRAFT_851454 [Obelidium mucronatum]